MFKSVLKNQQGLSLIEIMVVLTIMSLIGAGTTSLFRNVVLTQRKNNLKQSLNNFRDNLKNTIQSDDAWRETVGAYPVSSDTLGCMQDNVPTASQCAHNTVIDGFNVRDSFGAMFYEGEQTTQGINRDGQICNAYDTGAGNDECPYRYELQAQLNCPDQIANCQKPQLRITATFLANPQDKGGFLARIDADEYNFTIDRAERIRYEPLTLRYRIQDNSGGGDCTGNAIRPLNQLVNDVGENVVSWNANSFTLRSGTYECTITAQSYFLPNGFSILLENATTPNLAIGGGATFPVPIGSGYTPIEGTSTVTGKVRFNITANSTFQIRQYCQVSVTYDSSRTQYYMGIPTPDYAAGNTFTSVTCVRSS